MDKLVFVSLTMVIMAGAMGATAFGTLDTEMSYFFIYDEGTYWENVDVSLMDIYDIDASIGVDINGAYMGNGNFNSYGSTVVNFYDGYIRNMSSRGSSTINVYDGSAPLLFSFNSGTINLYGGNVNFLGAFESSTVHLYGYDFDYDLYDKPRNSEIVSPPVNGIVTGFWQDSTPFSIEIGNWYGDPAVDLDRPITFEHIVFHEIPEPTTLLILGLGVLTFRSRRKIYR